METLFLLFFFMILGLMLIGFAVYCLKDMNKGDRNEMLRYWKYYFETGEE